ncbi:MAG: penicillin-binding protein activator [Pseudoxanthomonas suwonensis]|nr:penicillin-binding protein activator [Pseudoxanthomonas suwonensis]
MSSQRLLHRLLATLVLGLLLAGCATAPTVTHEPPPPQRNTVLVEAEALAANDATLTGAARQANATAIARLLAGLDDAALQRAADDTAAEAPLYNFLGQALLARGLRVPKPFVRSDWRLDTSARPPAAADGYRPPLRVGLLLPLSGALANTAVPVRDGFLAGYHGESRSRPDIQFYDTAGGVAAAYARAVAEGVDYVIGPLARAEVDALFAQPALQVPVLVLNRGNRRPPSASVAFSLAPEDEGIAAAEYMFSRGARHVLVVAGGDDTLRRTADAFREAFHARGGQIVASLPEGTADFGAHAAAETPPDAVFLALRAASAAEVVPRLAVAGLGDRLRVGTSQIAGVEAAEAMGLDGIVFPTESWSVRNVPGLPSAAILGASLASARGPAARLFAFGFDAWRLAAYLEHLAQDPNARLDGATGQLGIDGFGNVTRRPAWSSFRGGVAVPLPDSR